MNKLIDDIIFAVGISFMIIFLFIVFILKISEKSRNKKYMGMTLSPQDDFILNISELSFKTSTILAAATYCGILFLTHKNRIPCKENPGL